MDQQKLKTAKTIIIFCSTNAATTIKAIKSLTIHYLGQRGRSASHLQRASVHKEEHRLLRVVDDQSRLVVRCHQSSQFLLVVVTPEFIHRLPRNACQHQGAVALTVASVLRGAILKLITSFSLVIIAVSQFNSQ